MSLYKKIISIFLITIVTLLFSGCGESRPQFEKRVKETEDYAKLIEDIKNLKINDKSQFLAGRAIMAQHLVYTFENLPKTSKGRITMVSDAVYWCPTKMWLENTLLPYCEKIFNERGARYRSQYDCDDFSRDFLSIALDRFRQENVKLPINSLCVAEAWYVTSYAEFMRSLGFPADDHAINFVVVSDDNEVVFIEPQTCKIIQLTEQEIQSIYFIRF